MHAYIYETTFILYDLFRKTSIIKLEPVRPAGPITILDRIGSSTDNDVIEPRSNQTPLSRVDPSVVLQMGVPSNAVTCTILTDKQQIRN